jgi:hypothetical protein
MKTYQDITVDNLKYGSYHYYLLKLFSIFLRGFQFLKIHKIATTIKAIPRMIKVILYPQGERVVFLSLPIPNKAIPSIAPIVVPKNLYHPLLNGVHQLSSHFIAKGLATIAVLKNLILR